MTRCLHPSRPVVFVIAYRLVLKPGITGSDGGAATPWKRWMVDRLSIFTKDNCSRYIVIQMSVFVCLVLLCVYIWGAKCKSHHVYVSKISMSHGDVIKWKHYRVTGPLWPLTRSFDIFFDLCLNNRLIKQSRRPWFEMTSYSLWGAHQVTNHLADQWWHISMTCQWQASCDDFKTTARANLGSHDDMSTFLLKTYRKYSWKIMFFKQVWWCFSIVFHNGIVRLTWQTNFLKQFILNIGKNVNHNLPRARFTNMDHL